MNNSKETNLSILEGGALMSTPEAIAWLKERGIFTSRRSLDDLRASGRLEYFRATGRIRILYRASDLADAFISRHGRSHLEGIKNINPSGQPRKYQSNEEKLRMTLDLVSQKAGIKSNRRSGS